jgi:predicted O-linked N-acetylglucosamine transferase (SPINDLY family)
MPFGGVNGTMEALSMSVPVVTLCGRKHSERTSYSIMKHLGIEGTLAASGSEYVDIAVRLAEDAGFRAEMRKTIRERLAVAPSADIGHYTRCLESAYEQALQLSAQAAGAEQV